MSETTAPRSTGAGVSVLLSDDRLAKRATEGDQRAFTAIFQRYHQSLYRFCVAIVGNPHDAQDALQNTMVKVLKALPGEERRIELKPWLYRIAHNESIELLRRRPAADQLDPELVARGSGLSEEAAVRERLRGLIADLGELPERQRGALVMRELAGLDFAEIGAALGTSSAVARQTAYEARLALHQMDAGREMTCETVTRVLSEHDGRVVRRRDLRAHLRSCSDCRRFRDEIDCRRRELTALSPLPAAAAAGILHGLLGGGGSGGSGGGLAAALGAGAAKSAGAPVVIKSAVAVVAVAAVGAAVVDRSSLVDPSSDHGGSQVTHSRAPASSGSGPAPQGRSDEAGVELAKPKARAALGGGAKQGRLHSAAAVAGRARTQSPDAPSEAIPAPASAGLGGSPAQRGGQAKELPSASAHGQETAAAHKSPHAVGHSPSAPTGAAKPDHPTHPTNPSSAKAPTSKGAEHKAQPDSANASVPPAGEGAAQPETGKKP